MEKQVILSKLEEGTYILLPCEEDDLLYIQEKLKNKERDAEYEDFKIKNIIAYGDPMTYNEDGIETDLQSRDIAYYISTYHQHGNKYFKCHKQSEHMFNQHTTGLLAFECALAALGNPDWVVLALIPHNHIRIEPEIPFIEEPENKDLTLDNLADTANKLLGDKQDESDSN